MYVLKIILLIRSVIVIILRKVFRKIISPCGVDLDAESSAVIGQSLAA